MNVCQIKIVSQWIAEDFYRVILSVNIIIGTSASYFYCRNSTVTAFMNMTIQHSEEEMLKSEHVLIRIVWLHYGRLTYSCNKRENKFTQPEVYRKCTRNAKEEDYINPVWIIIHEEEDIEVGIVYFRLKPEQAWKLFFAVKLRHPCVHWYL